MRFDWYPYFWRQFSRVYDRYCDAKYDVKTCGLRDVDQLQINPEIKRHASRYEATPYLLLDALFKGLPKQELPLQNLSRFTFIDYGSGMGRVLKVAQTYGFQKVIGIEADRSLAERSRENLDSRMPSKLDFEIIHASANVPVPSEGPTVHYFFNPFAWPLLQEIIENIKARSQTHSEQYVLLVNPAYKIEILAAGFVEIQRLKIQRCIFEVSILKAEPSITNGSAITR